MERSRPKRIANDGHDLTGLGVEDGGPSIDPVMTMLGWSQSVQPPARAHRTDSSRRGGSGSVVGGT